MGKIEFFKQLYRGDKEKLMFVYNAILNRREMESILKRKNEVVLAFPKEVNVYEVKNDGWCKVDVGCFTNEGIRINRRPNLLFSSGNLLFGEHSVISEYRNYTEGICVEICVIFERNDWYYKRWYKLISKSWN